MEKTVFKASWIAPLKEFFCDSDKIDEFILYIMHYLLDDEIPEIDDSRLQMAFSYIKPELDEEKNRKWAGAPAGNKNACKKKKRKKTRTKTKTIQTAVEKEVVADW